MHRLLFAGCLLASVPSQASASEYLRVTQSVSGVSNRICVAYIHGLQDSAKLPIVVSLSGTGVYTTGNLVTDNPVAQTLIDQKKAIVLSIDKPGIAFSEAAPNQFTIDDSIYNQYTQRDLIQCVINAIKWASTTKFATPMSDIYFLGHSEGTQIAIRAYKELLAVDSGTAARVQGLFLSGLVMEPWEKIINSQLSDPTDNAKFWDAFRLQDDAKLRSFGDLAFAYWEEIFGAESNEITLKLLAKNNPFAFLEVYQGLKDENTHAQPVMDFESWNRQNLNQSLPAWKLRARYYQAGHGLNLAALNDMIFALLAYLP